MSEHIYKPSRKLNFDTAKHNSDRLTKLFRDHRATCVRLDLKDVDQCDSAGLAWLIEAKRLSKKHQKGLVIEGLPTQIAILAEFCGVEDVLGS